MRVVLASATMPFPFAMNLRDLGGLRTSEGKQVQRGLLFRTGNLANLVPGEARALVDSLHIRTYYDLRVQHEIAHDGAPEALREAGVAWVHLPVDSFDATFGRHRLPATEHWTELYLKVFAQHRATWIALLRGAAEAEGPLLFGCTAGKDRTGIAAAVLLRCLGVGDEEILADYARTTDEMILHLARFARHFGPMKRTEAEFIAHFLTASRPILAGFLAGVDALHGGPEAALLDAGLEPRVLDDLRRRYLG